MLSRFFLLTLLFPIWVGCTSNPKPHISPKTTKAEIALEPATVKVFQMMPFAGMKGTRVDIEFRIARHPDNRQYRISWFDEDGEWGRKEKSLDGVNEPYIFPSLTLEGLYPGRYKVRLQVLRVKNGGKKEYESVAMFTVY